jgi:hypothetical protein
MAWTDERMDELANRMDAGFERTHVEIRELRAEVKGDVEGLRTDLGGDMKALRTDLGGDMKALRTELKGDIADVGRKVDGLQMLMVRVALVIGVAMAGVTAALVGAIATAVLV